MAYQPSPAGDPFRRIAERFQKLPSAQQRVAQELIERPTDVVFLSTEALGRRVGVSDSTVVRMAGTLGYAGYPELRNAVYQWLFRHVTPSEQFRRSLERGEQSFSAASLRADAANLLAMNSDALHRSVASAVRVLASAKAVRIVGAHASFAPAYLLHYLLSQVRDSVFLLGSIDGGAHVRLLDVTPGSAMVAFSLRRYSRQTHRIAKASVGLGASVIPITDSALSPIALLSPGAAIVLPCASSSFFHSQVSPIAVANTLVTGVADALRDRARDRLRRLEHLMSDFEELLFDEDDAPNSLSSSPDSGG